MPGPSQIDPVGGASDPTGPTGARLRVKDVDFGRNQLIVRGGKGDKDRITPLPGIASADLARQLEIAKKHAT